MASVEDYYNNQTFTWEGNDYPCVGSVSEVTKVLEDGGYSVDRFGSFKVRLQDTDGNDIFDPSIPEPQDTLTFQGEEFRILSVKSHPLGNEIRIMGESTNKGI